MKYYYKNNGELKKELRSTICEGYNIEIRLFHSEGRRIISTDLEINVMNEDGEFVDTFLHSSIESEGEWDEVIASNVKEFVSIKKKVYKYLDEHFHNVKIVEDYEG